MRSLTRSRFGRTAKRLIPAGLLVLSVATVVMPPSAQAQFFNWGDGAGFSGGFGWGGWGGMGPAQVAQAIGVQGFRIVAPLRHNGAVFVAEVIDRRGRRERLIVAAADGQILRRFILDEARMPRSARMIPGDDIEQQMDRVDRGELVPPVPPISIPNIDAPSRDYGTVDDNPVIEPIRPRAAPRPLRLPKPRMVDRTPDVIQPDQDQNTRQPMRLKIRPSEPMRLPSAPAERAVQPAPPAVTASRPPDAAPVTRPDAAPSTAPGNATAAPTTRMRDPLAIPRTEPRPVEAPRASAAVTSEPPRKVVPGSVTGAPPAKAPAKAGDVPVAPLD